MDASHHLFRDLVGAPRAEPRRDWPSVARYAAAGTLATFEIPAIHEHGADRAAQAAQRQTFRVTAALDSGGPAEHGTHTIDRRKGGRVSDASNGADGQSELALQMRSLDAVAKYYEQTRFDYWAVWQTRENLAFHFGYYDDHVADHRQALSNSNGVLADIARIGPGDRVLDAGCGIGGSSLWLAAHRGAEVVGITPVIHQVEAGTRIAAARGLQKKVRFERADYTATPFPDASFDVVWALESLCHARQKAAFYREAFRVLRPGGRLVIAEYIRRSRALAPDAEAQMREWLDGWSIPDLDTQNEHVAAAAAAGFAEVTLSDYTRLTRRSLRRLYRLACLATPVDWLLYALRLRSETQHGNVVASLRQYQLLREDAWFYGILSGTKPL